MTQLPHTLSQIGRKLPLPALTPAGGKRLLVAESDGFSLRALVVQQRGTHSRIEAQLQSRAVEPRAALAELLEQLQESGIKPPRDALLVCSGVIPALLKLPTLDSKRLGAAKMLELVRWEMEGLFSDQVSLWNIGWLLIGRGYLNEQQRDRILDALLQQDPGSGRNNRAPARFGEAAIAQGYINREQLEECLKLQEQLHLLDDSLLCGWSPQPTSSGHQAGLQLCCAMSQQLQQSWVAAFGHHRLRLQRIYPQAISAAGLLSPSSQPQLLVDMQQGFVACSRIEAGQLVQLAQQKCCERGISADALIELIQPLLSADISSIATCGDHPRRQDLEQTLHNTLQRDVVPLGDSQSPSDVTPAQQPDPQPSQACTAARLGALQHYLAKGQPLYGVSLQGQTPPPPLHRRPPVQAAAGLLLCLSGVAACEGYFYWQNQQTNDQIRANEEKLSRIEGANSRLSQDNATYRKLNEQIAELQAEFKQLKGRKEAVQGVLVERERFTAALLPMLASAIPDNVRLTAIHEGEWYRFELRGWALDQPAIETFNQQLSRALAPWQLRISDSPSEAGPGWHELDGFNFRFTIEPRV